MQTMELVDIEDVYPYEENDVRMNPRDVNSKECREYIAQLAEQFRYNRLNPGQPRVRPILYRDGGIYLIVDGECRYEAMKLAGTRKFYADVFDDLADAETARREAAKAMVETDCKRALTPEEMSRGVQTMLALDVPEEEVAAVARMDAGKVRRARRGARVVDDAAYDMTLDRLMAIAEFEGDEDAVAELRDCPQKDWRRVYERLSAARRFEEARRAVRGALEERGLAEFDGDRAAYRVVSSTYIDSDSDPGKLVAKVAAELEEEPCGFYSVEGHWAELMRPETDEEREEERVRRERDAERDRERARHRELWSLELKARDAWVAERLGDLRSMRATAELLADRAMEAAGAFIDRTGAEVDFSPSPALVAIGLALSWAPDVGTAVSAATGGQVGWLYDQENRICGFLELAGAMRADGYEPNETGAAVIAGLEKWKERNVS